MRDDLKRMCDKHNVPHAVGEEYLTSLKIHIAFVQQAGGKIDVPDDQLWVHDQSKFSEWEFPFYARNFHGNVSPVDQETNDAEFAIAWLHHENVNPHHWGFWIPRSGKFVNQPLPMQEKYVREMIADWHGAGKAYTGSWDISQWINENGPRMMLHNDTERFIWTIMHEVGYVATDNCNWSFMNTGTVFRD